MCYTLLFLDFFFLSCAEAEEEASERLLSSEVSEALSSEPGLEALSSEPGLEALSSEPGLTSPACSGVTRVRGASKIKMKYVNKKRMATARRLVYFGISQSIHC
jgi:hypothetical protein